jgi:hypothetical protein
VTGFFGGTVDFGGGPLASAGESDIFLAKFDGTGNHLWSQRFGAEGYDVGRALAVNALGDVFATGSFWAAVNFGGSPITSAGNDDIFLAKFDENGNHLWSRGFGDTEVDQGLALAVDGFGRVFVTGGFSGTVDFGGGPRASAGSTDIFLAKFDGISNHVWSERFGYTDEDWGRGVAVDALESVFVTGTFRETVSFGGAPLTSAGIDDIFLVKFDGTGNHVWSQGFGSTNSDWGRGVAVDALRSVFLTGTFQNTVNFGGFPLTSAGRDDGFLAKFGEVVVSAPIRFPGFALGQNHPNPFNPTTSMTLWVDHEGPMQLIVYDVRGRRVRTLVVGPLSSGRHVVEWDGRDDWGQEVSSGVYFIRAAAGQQTITRKAVLLK